MQARLQVRTEVEVATQLGSAEPIMRIMWREVCRLNERGSRCSFMSVSSCSSWLPLRRLQSWQQATRFSQVERPPRERGTTWSRVSSLAVSTMPQYWQALRSRSRMFLRESARV